MISLVSLVLIYELGYFSALDGNPVDLRQLLVSNRQCFLQISLTI